MIGLCYHVIAKTACQTVAGSDIFPLLLQLADIRQCQPRATACPQFDRYAVIAIQYTIFIALSVQSIDGGKACEGNSTTQYSGVRVILRTGVRYYTGGKRPDDHDKRDGISGRLLLVVLAVY